MSGKLWTLRDHYGNNIVIVLFRFKEGQSGKPEPNNYVVTAYQKEIG